jgi:hypothetical protein
MRLDNPQAEVNRLSNLIRDSIAPRIAGVSFLHMVCSNGEVLIIRIPRSWSRPHMVTFGGVNKFFGRAGATKYPISVDEIGRSFSERGELRDAIAAWRSNRASLSAQGKGPDKPAGPVSLLFHVIPASAFTRNELRESWAVPEQEKLQVYVPHGITNFRYNADGFLCLASTGAQSEAFGYTQLFRSGIIEYADGYCYGPQWVIAGR